MKISSNDWCFFSFFEQVREHFIFELLNECYCYYDNNAAAATVAVGAPFYEDEVEQIDWEIGDVVEPDVDWDETVVGARVENGFIL